MHASSANVGMDVSQQCIESYTFGMLAGNAMVHCRTVIDFNNAFGWHALPVDDPAWCSEAFCAKWMAIAKSGCRGTSDGLPVANGPLDPTSELAATASRLTPEGSSSSRLRAPEPRPFNPFMTLQCIPHSTVGHDRDRFESALFPRLLRRRSAFPQGANGILGLRGKPCPVRRERRMPARRCAI